MGPNNSFKPSPLRGLGAGSYDSAIAVAATLPGLTQALGCTAMNRDYTTVGHWCIDAHNVTAAEIPEKVAQLRLAAITAHIGKPSIIGIARDLSEGLDGLSSARRSSAQDFLRSKHGFGFDYFLRQGQLKLARVIARGKVRNENEHRMIIDALSDTTIDSSVSAQLEMLLAAHESKSGAA